MNKIPGTLKVSYDETVKMWAVFYTTDRPQDEVEHQEGIIMCDYHTVAMCDTKELADNIAKLSEENVKLKDLHQQYLEAVESIAGRKLDLQDVVETIKAFPDVKQINTELLKALEKTNDAFQEYANHRKDKGTASAKRNAWNLLVFKIGDSIKVINKAKGI